jgi:hypothetical protein
VIPRCDRRDVAVVGRVVVHAHELFGAGGVEEGKALRQIDLGAAAHRHRARAGLPGEVCLSWLIGGRCRPSAERGDGDDERER